jgi:polyhydroxyalkanoate synthesis regulator phasin
LLPDPLANHNLTEQQRRFVIEKSKGKTNTQAALLSYDCNSLQSAKVIGSQLMSDPEINTAIQDLMTSEGLTRRYRVSRLKQHVDNRDPNISLKALDQSWRLDGSYAPEKHLNVNVDIDRTSREIEELKRQLAEIEERERELLSENTHEGDYGD